MPTFIITFKSMITDPIERAARLKMFVKHAKRIYGLRMTNIKEYGDKKPDAKKKR